MHSGSGLNSVVGVSNLMEKDDWVNLGLNNLKEDQEAKAKAGEDATENKKS
jgi:hypothetical protein